MGGRKDETRKPTTQRDTMRREVETTEGDVDTTQQQVRTTTGQTETTQPVVMKVGMQIEMIQQIGATMELAQGKGDRAVGQLGDSAGSNRPSDYRPNTGKMLRSAFKPCYTQMKRGKSAIYHSTKFTTR